MRDRDDKKKGGYNQANGACIRDGREGEGRGADDDEPRTWVSSHSQFLAQRRLKWGRLRVGPLVG